MVTDLDTEIAAYERIEDDLKAHHTGKWVVVHNEQVVDTYDSFASAAQDAVSKFGRGPYLIRQIGGPPVTLPASVMFFQAANADH